MSWPHEALGTDDCVRSEPFAWLILLQGLNQAPMERGRTEPGWITIAEGWLSSS